MGPPLGAEEDAGRCGLDMFPDAFPDGICFGYGEIESSVGEHVIFVPFPVGKAFRTWGATAASVLAV